MAAPKGNEYWKLAINPGRKKAFETPQDFIDLASKYFEENDGNKISWTGLCLSVGVSSRQALDRYRNGLHGEEFVGPVKKALMVVENYYEEESDGAKGIFALKNFGWKDQKDLTSSDGSMSPKRDFNDFYSKDE